MNWFSNIRNTVGRALLREHAGGLVDDDDHLFSPLVAAGQETALDGQTRDRQRRLARVHYHRHAVGGALPDMLVARVVGADFAFKAEDPAVQAVVDRFVTDPDNDLAQYLPLYATERWVFGELVLPIFLTPENADVRLGYISPEQIETVVFRSGDAKRPIAILQRRQRTDDVKRLWIIPHPDPAHDNRFPPHPALTDDEEPGSVPGENGQPVVLPNVAGVVLPEIAGMIEHGDVKVAGYAFYHRSGNLVTGRGQSQYSRINDWLKAVDDWFFGTLRNAVLQGAFVWWIKLTGGSEASVTKRQKELSKPPKPGSIVVTNEREEWAALTPALPPGAQVREIFSNTMKLIGLAVGFPGHEVAAEDDTNRSTAKESRSVSINRAKRFQREICSMVGTTWLGYQVDQKVYRGQLPEGIDRTVTAVLPELDARDEAEAAGTFKDTVDAAVTAVDRELMLQRDARAAVYATLGREAPSEKDFQDALVEERQRRDESYMAGGGERLAALIKQIEGGAPKAGTGAVPREEP